MSLVSASIVALDPFAGQARHFPIVEIEASAPGVYQQLGNRIDRDIADPRDRAHGRSFAEHLQDLDALL
jgi:hypothetical protein